MLAIVSPAKKLNFDRPDRSLPHSQPQFARETGVLVKTVKKLSRTELQRLMKLSDRLGELNFQRFKAFAAANSPGATPAGGQANGASSKQAALAFMGDTYVGLDAASLDEDGLAWAQDHLRILSGLYGLLRPLDLIQPYRLEMGSRLANPKGANLYDFWGDGLARAIEETVAGHPSPVVVNLASNEYFKAAEGQSTGGQSTEGQATKGQATNGKATKGKNLKTRVITPVFKEVKDGEARVIGMFAKQARGMMARYMIDKRLENPAGLKKFKSGGYAYRKDLSDGDTWVFTRGK